MLAGDRESVIVLRAFLVVSIDVSRGRRVRSRRSAENDLTNHLRPLACEQFCLSVTSAASSGSVVLSPLQHFVFAEEKSSRGANLVATFG